LLLGWLATASAAFSQELVAEDASLSLPEISPAAIRSGNWNDILLESNTKLGPGHQRWLQVLVSVEQSSMHWQDIARFNRTPAEESSNREVRISTRIQVLPFGEETQVRSSFSGLKNHPLSVPSPAQFRVVSKGHSPIPTEYSPTFELPLSEVRIGDTIVYFDLPVDWAQSQNEAQPDKVHLKSFESKLATEIGNEATPSDIVIGLLPNTQSLSLDQYVEDYSDGLYSDYLIKTPNSVGSFEAIVLDDTGRGIPSAPALAAFAAVGDQILLVVGNWMVEDEFFEILESMEAAQ
jgi:hypothetical protein